MLSIIKPMPLVAVTGKMLLIIIASIVFNLFIGTEASCKIPLSPEHGSLDLIGGSQVNSIVLYSCSKGWKLEGAPFSKCLITGEWTFPPPKCISTASTTRKPEVQLGSCIIPTVSNGSVGYYEKVDQHQNNQYTQFQVGKALRHGETAILLCTEGFVPHDSSEVLGAQSSSDTVTCENGMWSKPLLCKPDQKCGPPPKIEGTLEPHLDAPEAAIGTSIAYRCEFGYVNQDSKDFRSICHWDPDLRRATWTNPNVVCIPRSCGEPEFVPNAHRIGNLFTFPNKVEFQCQEGYELKGPAVRYCQESGTWSGRLPKCDPRSCGEPGLVSNAHRIGNHFTFPNKVEFQCQEGYKLKGPAVRYCQRSGTWSGRLPKCDQVNCAAPANPEHGRVRYSSLEYGTELRYECDKGFFLSQHEERTCTADGTWSNTEPVCIESSCEMPLAPKHGTMHMAGIPKVGTIALYSCKEGTTRVGPSASKCLITGEWTFPPPKCLSPCVLSAIPNGDVGNMETRRVSRYKTEEWFVEFQVGKIFKDEETAIFRCRDGFEPIESTQPAQDWRRSGEVVTCRDGQWSKSLECKPESCYGEPPPVDNGYPVVNNRSHGVGINYHCHNYYVKAGKDDVKCSYGQWTGETPKCIDSRCYASQLNHPGLEKPSADFIEHGKNYTATCIKGLKAPREGTKVSCNSGKWNVPADICVEAIFAQGSSSHRSSVHACDESSCYPATGNLLTGRESDLWASSTCGTKGVERYCIVSHLNRRKKCFHCHSVPNQKDSIKLYHGIENIASRIGNKTKGAQKWWQSENGVDHVQIGLDMKEEFHFTHLIITFKTFRPAAMLIERSHDFGRTWKVYQYYAYDCAESFPNVPRGPRQKISDVVCDSHYSDVYPSTNGEVIFRVIPPNIPIDNPYSSDVQNLLKMTNLRINFTKLHTLEDNLLLDSWGEIKEKYYYAIYDMVVRGSCSCYGHASRCVAAPGVVANPDMVHGQCECTHYTKGSNCEQCEDLFNDLEWKPAIGRQTNACKRCNCNGHASRCHFDRAVFEASGGVSGGVCDDCEHNTMGRNCELCKPFFYQDPGRNIRDPNICQGISVSDKVAPNPPASKEDCVCTYNGNWRLKALLNGYRIWRGTNFRKGESIQLGCADEGRRLTLPNGTMIMFESVIWTCYRCGSEGVIEMLTCEEVQFPEIYCETPKDPENGGVYYQSLSVGSELTFVCDNGYYLQDTGPVYCTSDVEWSKTDVKCVGPEILCPPIPETGDVSVHFTNSRKINSTVHFRCKDANFKIVGGLDTRTCQPSGEWSGANPDCEAIGCLIGDFVDTAPRNLLPSMEGVTEELQPVGSELAMNCENGWVLIEGKTATCGHLGTWDFGKAQCVVGCHLNVEDEESEVMIEPIKEYYRFGESITVSCPNGFTPTSDVQRVVCIGTKWSDMIPSCREIWDYEDYYE